MLRRLGFADPLRWLAARLARLPCAAPAIGLFYGACFMVDGLGAADGRIEHAPAYALALSAGFLLVGPFLVPGPVPRQPARSRRGEKPDFGDSLLAWDTRTGHARRSSASCCWCWRCCGAAPRWWCSPSASTACPTSRARCWRCWTRRTSASSSPGSPSARSSPALIFAVSVVSIPMILHRQTDAITAGLTSMRLVLDAARRDAVLGRC
ncbi:MAG: DUF2189 domain-containing protein [Comamonadaceae bacterium]|nr:DUF2189 domain-containing protein [Comamonadaceae bacterium]